jgi:hypothetical protein
MRWKLRCMNEIPYRLSYYMEEGLRMSLGRGLMFPSHWVPAKSVYTFSGHKKNQLFVVYVRWKSKLRFLSLIVEVNINIYQQEK